MLHNGNYMNEIIENIAVQAGFIKDKYGLYWDNDDNAEGVDLERFSELIVSECMDVLTDVLPPNVPESRDGIHPVWHIKQHFGVE